MSSYVECIRKLTFCSGHRVLGHEGKCANAHGHNYSIYLHATSSGLDKLGRVIDFSIIKEKMGKWIDENWDHTFIVSSEDHELIKNRNILEVNKKIFIADFNPTAENLALFLLNTISPKLFKNENIMISKIELCETENCKVIVGL